MRASLTGHLVLSTLHTNDAPSALWRLRDIGVEAYLVASTMKLVVAQRLVRRVCKGCAQPRAPSEQARNYAAVLRPESRKWTFTYGEGCLKCGQTGFHGRSAIVEFLEITDPIRGMIVEGRATADFRRRCVELGMEPLALNGLRKVEAGETTVEEVMSVCAGDEG